MKLPETNEEVYKLVDRLIEINNQLYDIHILKQDLEKELENIRVRLAKVGAL